ncbi:MAG: hypothetical protein ABJA49_07675 [Betaproteobacteria bacterium]
MQLPTFDRQPGLRPAGADLAPSNGQKVIPVAPVNPPVTVNAPQLAIQPGVVNKIGEGSSMGATQGSVYQSVADPIRRGQESAAEPHDWTIQHPEPEKVVDPPPIPMHQLLLDFIKSMWQASAMAVELSQVQKHNVLVNPANPNATPGEIAKENLTYTPSKIKKTENI